MSSNMSMSNSAGKGKGKAKGKATSATPIAHHDGRLTGQDSVGVQPESMPTIVPCAPYLPALQHVPDHVVAHAHRLAIHTLTTALRAPDPATFARIAHHGNLLEFIETYLRFRPPYPPTSLSSPAADRALDVLTFAWFRNLAAYVATPAAMDGATGAMVTEMVLDHVSALMILDFCKWYGHCMPAAGRIVADLVQARPVLSAEIEDVVRVCSHLMGKQVTAHMGGTSPTHLAGMPSPGGDAPVDPLVVADALSTFKSLIRVLPPSVTASAFDDAFLSTLAGFFDAVLAPNGDARTLSLTTRLAMDVITCRFLAEPTSGSIGHLATLLHMMLDLAHAQHGAGEAVDGSLIAAVVADTSLVDDLKGLDQALFLGDTSIVTQLEHLRSQVLEHRQAREPEASLPPAPVAATADVPITDDPDTAVAITQVLDLFPDMSAAAIRHLLLQYSNDTAKLIDALLMDESLRSFQPPVAAAVPPEPEHAVDEALLASVRERFAHVEEFATAKQVAGRSMVKESKSDAKRKVLALAARIAAEDDEQAQWDDEYDDTYDAVDVRVADGTAEEEVESSAAGPKRPAAVKRSNVGSEAMVNDPAAQFEADLFHAWSANAAVFDRAGKRLPERARLRERTGMSDQQIEGWASMLRRTPARVRHLQNKYQFAGNRTEARAAITGGEQGQNGDAQSAESSPRRDGRPAGSGHGGSAGRGRGRGGSNAQTGPQAGSNGSDRDSPTSAGRGRWGGRGRGGKDVRAERVKAHWKKTKDMA